ncbi:phycobilisome rod-core linker polypeptide [Cyanobium sp. T1B-Tous]|nr:phycobilisome rod-core linker polypeptide [Cyanobium sp. T1B-Tous]
MIRAVYKHVLGHQFVRASERLKGQESLFNRGHLSVGKFVRQAAKSGLYKQKSFEHCNPYQLIELNFKHLLGRAPQRAARECASSPSTNRCSTSSKFSGRGAHRQHYPCELSSHPTLMPITRRRFLQALAAPGSAAAIR